MDILKGLAKMKTLVLMIAPPGAGKSTLAMKLAKSGLFSDLNLIVSTDRIRERLFGDETYQGGNREVFETAYNDVEEALAFCDDVCVFVDACNCTDQDRRKFTRFAIANPGTKIVGILYDGTVKECLDRNERRERVVPRNVVLRFYDLIPHSMDQLLYENPEFDAIIPFSLAEEMTRKEI